MAEYDFSNTNTPANSTLPDIDDFASARVEAGVEIDADSKILSFDVNVFGLGSGAFIGYGGQAQIDIPF